MFTAHNTINCPSLASLSVEDRAEMIQVLLASLSFEDKSEADDYNYTDDNYQQEGDMFHQPQGQEPTS